MLIQKYAISWANKNRNNKKQQTLWSQDPNTGNVLNPIFFQKKIKKNTENRANFTEFEECLKHTKNASGFSHPAPQWGEAHRFTL